MKRILILSTAYEPFIGGAEIAVKEITSRINTHEFLVITALFDRSLPRSEKIGNVEIYRVGVGVSLFDKFLLPFLGFLKIYSIEREKKIDSFWCIMVSYAAWAAYIWNTVVPYKKKPIILTVQEGDSESYIRTRFFGLIAFSWKLMLKRVTIVTAISTYLGELIRSFGYIGPIEYIPNGVDIEKFREVDLEEVKKIRCSLNISIKDTVLITTSRLVKKNAVEDIVLALTYLSKDVKLLILGDGVLRINIEKKIKELGLTERVSILGFIDYKYISSYLHVSHIFIRPSLSEGMGNSFIEAMAARIPVIATPVGGILDFIEDKKTGVFCNVHDPKSIAQAVDIIRSNQELKITLVENAYRKIAEKYDWNYIVRLMEDVLITAKV